MNHKCKCHKKLKEMKKTMKRFKGLVYDINNTLEDWDKINELIDEVENYETLGFYEISKDICEIMIRKSQREEEFEKQRDVRMSRMIRKRYLEQELKEVEEMLGYSSGCQFEKYFLKGIEIRKLIFENDKPDLGYY